MFSLASVATMSACIFLFGLFFSIILNLQYMVKSAEEGVAITVFFDEGISDARIEQIGEELEAREEVSSIRFVSAEEAWDNFKEDYFGDNAELAEGFKNDNPLASSASYEVFMKVADDEDKADITSELRQDEKSLSEKQKDLVAFAESLDGVRKVNRSDVVANTLSSVNKLVGYVSIVIIAILLAVSIFLISNTVTMGITVRKEEIAIMKYIGAKDFVVRSPFVIEGLVIGIVGALIPLTVLYFAYEKVVDYVMTKFSILNNIIEFLSVQSVYKSLLPIGILMGVGIGFVGSYFTCRKHLKV
jgi:cell division transport system permease protein